MSPKAASKARVMTILAAFIALVVLVVGGVFGVQPLWEQASEANTAAEDQEARNDNEQLQVNRLRAQFAKIDDYRALLEELREQVPTTLQTQEFQRQFTQFAEDNDVTVTSIKFAASSPVTLTNAEADLAAKGILSEARGGANADQIPTTAPANDGDSDTGDAAAASESSTGANNSDANKPRFTDVYTLPVSIEVSGNYYDILEVVRSLQNSEQRLMIVTGLSGQVGDTTANEDAEADWLQLTIEGLIAVLLDPESEPSVVDDEAVERPELPSTKGNKGNPLLDG